MAGGSVIGFGASDAQRVARVAPRSISDGAGSSIRYPSPFFDIAHVYMPTNFRSLLKWCRYYFLANPLINAVCYKMAEYPVTDLVFDTDNVHLKKKWTHFFQKVLRFKRAQVEIGLDKTCYGNAFVSIYYPFIKYLRCPSCSKYEQVSKVRYTFRDFKFVSTCRSCNWHGPFDTFDHYVRSENEIRLIRWSPEHISIEHNEVTGESLYYYHIPASLRNDVMMAKRHVIEKLPKVFLEAMKQDKSVLFDSRKIFHMKRSSISQKDKGWGLPMILPVLKDTFYLQILRKAQEAIAVEHIVPLRVLFPQSASGSSDVYSSVNISDWRTQVEREIMRWRLDNNYIPLLPLPVGQQTLGAEGRALMLHQEMRVWAEHIIAGMGVPIEFVFGGMQYSGSNVSMRILENHFLDHRSDDDALVDWVMEDVGAHMGWSPIGHHFKRFKMADDLQRSAFNLQLNSAGKLSNQSLLEETDWDWGTEQARIDVEQKKSFDTQRRQALSQAEIQGEAQLAMQKYQMRAQRMLDKAMEDQAAMTPGGPAEQGLPPVVAPGVPGQISPETQGQMLTEQQAHLNRTGAGLAEAPPIASNPMATMESPLNADQRSTVSVADPMALVTNPGLLDIAANIAGYLDQLDDAQKQGYLVQLRDSNPQLYSIILMQLNQRVGAHQPSTSKPMPEQRPPRRGPEAQTL